MAVNNLLNLEAVSKSFDIRALLDGVSLGVNAGDRIGIVGRNGGGKSTLIKVMAGIEAPDSGRVSKAGSVSIGLLGKQITLMRIRWFAMLFLETKQHMNGQVIQKFEKSLPDYLAA
jgi:ATPase subunit of ABC transporter with duplicated ATPase domains